jgi:Tol biopolymer transport system component
MPLPAGTLLGPYEILAEIGAGGMGDVYKSRDTRLDRVVAIKVLPSELAGDPELRRRLEREARAISALNHPHICTLFDVGRQQNVDFLVLEYLEGETLGARLAQGPLPLSTAVGYAVQIADALERAHRAGIVHRDLKPANIMLTRNGVKLLDFGLAQMKPAVNVAGGHGNASEGDVAPTRSIAPPLTSEGTILGTLHYMAPEQVEGRRADPRSDLFALGAVLYEMLTGRRPFDGASAASLIGAILRDDPPEIGDPKMPAALEHVIRTCLAKDPDDRWQTAHDVKLQLQWIQKRPAAAAADRPTPESGARFGVLSMAAAIVLALATGAGLTYVALRSLRGDPSPATAVRAIVPAPDGTSFHFVGDFAGGPVLAADGSAIVFAGVTAENRRRLYVRRLDSLDVRPLAATDGASWPFWSPDGRSVGFFADGWLKRVDIAGGPAFTITAATNGRGATWSPDGTIVFEPDTRSGLYAVASAGGAARPVTEVDRTKHTTHRWPQFLPDGKKFLFLAASHATPGPEASSIFIGSTDGGGAELVLQGTAANALYASGRLLFVRDRTLIAQRFDSGRRRLEGDPVPVAEDIQVDLATWRAVFDASESGVLVYQRSGTVSGSTLSWYSRSGQTLTTIEERVQVYGLALSGASGVLAVAAGDPSADVWLYPPEGVKRRLTFGPAIVYSPVWSPDGKEVVFSSDLFKGAHGVNLYRKAASGAGGGELLLESPFTKTPTHWSQDGRFIAFNQYDPRQELRRDVWILDVASRKPYPLLQSAAGESDAQFSADGRWVAFVSNASGRDEVHVIPFRDPTSEAGAPEGGRWQVSTSGGQSPRWRRDSREIYFISAEGNLMAAALDVAEKSVSVKGVHLLFKASARPLTINQGMPYDVAPDGERFVVNTLAPQLSQPIVVVANWTQGGAN